MSRIKKPRCSACNSRDCKGWQPGDPSHEYEAGNWKLGCHCDGCCRARDEAGGFIGLITKLHQPAPAREE